MVDDEEGLIAVTSEMLQHLGYEPVAVITDEVMPGFTGTELARALRRRGSEVPIVLVSGYIGPVMSQRALAAGVNEILKKPVQTREIAAVLARLR